jgi:hypothetical protein
MKPEQRGESMIDALAIEIGDAETRVALVILSARFGVRN